VRATRGGRRAPVGLGGGGGVRGGDGSAEEMTGGSPLSASAGEGRAERRWPLGQKANWASARELAAGLAAASGSRGLE
jgi:hypothetical protein